MWGTGGYDESMDALRVDVPASYGNPSVEKFTITASNDGKVSLKWDDMVTGFTVE